MSAPGSDLIFPPFSSLPLDKNGPPRNAWGRFGPSDELGMLNLLTPELVAAAAKEIKTGESISLDLPMDHFRYPFFNRERFEWKVKNWAEPPHLTRINDDVLTFNTQSSTQWDGFRHFGRLLCLNIAQYMVDRPSACQRWTFLERPISRGSACISCARRRWSADPGNLSHLLLNVAL